jgi:hypothetical protein
MERTRSELIKKLIRAEELSLQEAQILGDTSGTNPNIPFQYIIRGDKFLGSEIYQRYKGIAPISSTCGGYVAKLTNHHWNLKIEAENLELGNKIDIPLVKYYGVRNIYNISHKKFDEAIILDRIYGGTICEIFNLTGEEDEEKLIRLERRWGSAVDKAEKYFFVQDRHNENAIFEYGTQKIILIDPEEWVLKLQ